MRIKPAGKVIILVLVAGFAYGGWRVWQTYGKDIMANIAPEKATKASGVPLKADLPDINPTLAGSAIKNMKIPGSEPGCTDKPEITFLHWAWNSQMGLMFANGGKQATEGSLMCKHGVNLKLVRQDDPSKMQEALVAFATALKNGDSQPTEGAHFVAIMGDGAAAFLAGINPVLKRLGPEYKAKVIGSCGYSRGEDKFMGPPSWKLDPSKSRGGVVAGYLRDGDWNIAMKWLADNGLKNNPDEKTWDPDALNWVAANDYIDAAEKYITGYTETRPVVRNGRKTGETKQIRVQAVVTWTPGDVSVAEKKGGLVSIVSTKEYASQMPNAIIGIDKWMRNNRPVVEGMLQAITEGGDAVKASSMALDHAAEISAVVYNEQGADADYWKRYYKGTVERDKQGLEVELGGSYVNNLADNLITFGLVPGSANLFGATYTVFGDIVVDQYPELVPNYPPINEVLDTSYLKALAKRAGPSGAMVASVKPTYKPSGGTSTRAVVSRRAWNIPFESGKATFSPGAKKALEKLRQDLLVASGTTIEIHGHTDSKGSPAANMNLSEARAFAVQRWLEKTFPVNFPSGRTRVFAHGQGNPVAPNTTEGGRAKNRRVEIVLRAG